MATGQQTGGRTVIHANVEENGDGKGQKGVVREETGHRGEEVARHHLCPVFICDCVRRDLRRNWEEDRPVSAQEFPIRRRAWILRGFRSPSTVTMPRKKSKSPDSPMGILHVAAHQSASCWIEKATPLQSSGTPLSCPCADRGAAPSATVCAAAPESRTKDIQMGEFSAAALHPTT